MKNQVQHIRAFLAVARYGSFARAAQMLHLSPPALTVQIRQLEEWLGTPLLERSPRHVQLTAAGREVIGPMEQILLDLEHIQARAQDLLTLRKGRVRIAALPTVFTGPFPHVLSEFRQRHPGVEIHIQDVFARQVRMLVHDEQVDFGVTTESRLSPGLSFSPLFEDRLCLFAYPEHPLAQRPHLRLSDLEHEPLLLTSPESSVRDRIEQAFSDANLHLIQGLSANHMSTLLSLVDARLGIALLPESAAGESNQRVRIPLNDASLNRCIGVITRPDRPLPPAAAAFLAVWRDVQERCHTANN